MYLCPVKLLWLWRSLQSNSKGIPRSDLQRLALFAFLWPLSLTRLPVLFYVIAHSNPSSTRRLWQDEVSSLIETNTFL